MQDDLPCSLPPSRPAGRRRAPWLRLAELPGGQRAELSQGRLAREVRKRQRDRVKRSPGTARDSPCAGATSARRAGASGVSGGAAASLTQGVIERRHEQGVQRVARAAAEV